LRIEGVSHVGVLFRDAAIAAKTTTTFGADEDIHPTRGVLVMAGMIGKKSAKLFEFAPNDDIFLGCINFPPQVSNLGGGFLHEVPSDDGGGGRCDVGDLRDGGGMLGERDFGGSERREGGA
jgi:hypothetical protein